MVEKQEIEISQKISHKDFFSKLKFIQFLLKLGYNSSNNENMKISTCNMQNFLDFHSKNPLNFLTHTEFF